jgi:hypothetical protein
MKLAVLFDPVTGIGLPASTLGRDLRLAAELGLDSHLALNDPEAFHSMIADSVDSTSAAEYTEVSSCLYNQWILFLTRTGAH